MKKTFKLLVILTICLLLTSCGKTTTTEAKKYSVFFITNTTSTLNSIQDILSDSTITLPTNLEKEGYVLGGWFKDDKYTEEFTNETKINEDYILYAKWLKICTVSFETNGSEKIEKKEVTEGSTLTTKKPILEGYDFVGWYLDSNLTQEFTKTSTVNDNITLYAKWEMKKFTISFVSNGGTNIESINDVYYKNNIVLPNDPTKEDYGFAGWYDENKVLFSDDTEVTNNTILYAKWLSPSASLAYEDIDEETCKVTGIGDCEDINIYIPSFIEEKKVVAIEEGAFQNTYYLRSIVIPESVTYIGKNAFSNCKNLSYVNFSSKLENLGAAFDYCTSLKKVSLPDTLTKIVSNTFSNCTSLVTLNISSDTISIENNAFTNCTSLVTINILSNTTSIENNAFINCCNVINIFMEENDDFKVENNCLIDKKTMTIIKGCSTSIIPDGIKIIGECAFSNTNIENIELPESITDIKANAFSGCTSLKNLFLNKGIETIEEGAFLNCTSLKKVFYGGTIADYDKITISSENNQLSKVTIYYYSDTKLGRCWHLVDGKREVWTEEAFALQFISDDSIVATITSIPYGWTFDISVINLTKEGYSLVGWYYEKTFENEFTKDTIIDKVTIVYANWRTN